MKTLAATLLCIATLGTAQQRYRATFAPIVAVSRYVIDDQPVVGPTIGFRYQSREFQSSRIGVAAGVILRPAGTVLYNAEPFIYTGGEKMYQMQPPISNGAFRQTRFDVGMGFLGLDWKTYVLDGDLRPYVGVGARFVTWSASSALTGAVMPEAMAGFELNMNERLSAFAETEYMVGMPAFFGTRSSTLSNIATFAVGLSFAPRW